MPELTDAELLALAVAFDAGPPPVVNGWIVPEDCSPRWFRHHVRVRKRADGWTIGWFEELLNRAGGWEDDRPDGDADYLARTRFASPREALAFYREWRAAEVGRARAAGMEEWKATDR